MLSEANNLELLNKRISELNLKGKVVLAFDFDELVVPIHLTREVSKQVSKPLDKELLNKFGSCSFKGIEYLNSLIYGYNLEDYKKIRDKIAKETNWTKGFETLLRILQEKYSVIFLSSGIKDICSAKLNEIDFDSRNILGDEFKIEDNKIAGSNLIISDELKGFIIQKLKKDYKVIAIGHSLGDKIMLDNADVSISINSKIKDLAKYNLNSAKEALKIIEMELA
jgi:phosphoserine phosphatase